MFGPPFRCDDTARVPGRRGSNPPAVRARSKPVPGDEGSADRHPHGDSARPSSPSACRRGDRESRLRRAKRRIASGPTTRAATACHVTGPRPLRLDTLGAARPSRCLDTLASDDGPRGIRITRTAAALGAPSPRGRRTPRRRRPRAGARPGRRRGGARAVRDGRPPPRRRPCARGP